MRDKEKDAAQMAIKRQNMIETAYRLFSERNIDSVSMPDIARECGYGIATLYRYFNSKTALVIAAGTWAWESFVASNNIRLDAAGFEHMDAAGEYEAYLDTFLDLYRNHRDLLRFNQFFNIYIAGADAKPELMKPYMDMIEGIITWFHSIYAKAESDGTLRTDISENDMFTFTIHIMLAAVTRYAVGLVYTPDEETGNERELRALRNMLLKEYTVR